MTDDDFAPECMCVACRRRRGEWHGVITVGEAHE